MSRLTREDTVRIVERAMRSNSTRRQRPPMYRNGYTNGYANGGMNGHANGYGMSHPSDLAPPRSAVHTLALGLVWLAVFLGAFVATEPAPVDAMMIGLVVLLPVVGLTAITTPHLVYLATWLLITSAGFVAVAPALLIETAAMHTGVSLYLCIASFVIAAFVAKKPDAHSRLILRASVAAALVAAITGMIGYFDAIPGAQKLFTLHGRAAGSFKDPNVYAPFLVPPMVYLLHEMLTRSLHRTLLPMAGLGVLGAALLLSFSRGAWVNFLVAVAVYGYLSLITARTDKQRLKLIFLSALGGALAGVLILVALEFDQVSRLFAERFSLSQTYDEGPEGRFGGQWKAIGVILENPLGIGALQFGGILHPEHPHNIYLSMFLNAGWLGGLLYIALIGMSLAYGLKAVFERTWASRTLLVAYAAFCGLAVEGMVVETDHWRIFYLVLALLWGSMFPSETLRRNIEVATRLPAQIAAHIPVALQGPLASLPMRPPLRAARILGLAVPAVIAGRGKDRRRHISKRRARLLLAT